MAENVERCRELQEEEIVALSSIYENNFVQISENSFEIKIVCEDESWWSMTLRIMMTPSYPQKEPPLYEIFGECLENDDLEKMYQRMDEIWQEYKGECVLFMWIEKCKEILNERKERSPKMFAEIEMNVKSEKNSENDKNWSQNETTDASNIMVSAKDCNEISNEELDTSIDDKKALSQKDFNFEVPEIMSGETIVDRKSIFQAHVAYVETEKEVKKVIEKLKENRKIARATHNIMAFRVQGSREDTFLQDYDDDGENEAGGRLMHLLKILNAKNIVVIVSRWYGGILLGPDRFKHINNCARELIVNSAIFTENKEECPAANKKNKKKIKKHK